MFRFTSPRRDSAVSRARLQSSMNDSVASNAAHRRAPSSLPHSSSWLKVSVFSLVSIQTHLLVLPQPTDIHGRSRHGRGNLNRLAFLIPSGCRLRRRLLVKVLVFAARRSAHEVKVDAVG